MANATKSPIREQSKAKIRRLKSEGASLRELAEQYNTTVWQIRKTVAGR